MITIKNSAQIEKMRKAGAMLHDVLMQVKQRVLLFPDFLFQTLQLFLLVLD